MKKESISLETFKDCFLNHEYNENMFLENGKINPNYNSRKKTGLIAQILEDHWDSVYQKHAISIEEYRPNAKKEIQKVIDCHNKDLGCSLYECPNCHDYIFVGHTCKSRFCSSCGYKYKFQRVESILQHAYHCKHRQIVFTIPKELRLLFFCNFALAISLLFQAVNETIHSILNVSFKYSATQKKKKLYHSKINWIPGFFAFLHTFGRDLKWNPHIHILIAELKLSKSGLVQNWNYFNYNALSKRFQKNLLDLLEKNHLLSKEEVRKQYFNHPNGYYVYAEPKKFKSLKDGIEYVTRYCGRVAISENRIKSYDGENVTFFYNAHEDDSYHEVTVSAEQFILMLLRHLIPEQFKIIRYYGFYRKKEKICDTMKLLISEEKRNIRNQFLLFELSVQKAFHISPLECPNCHTRMEYVIEIT